jgi:hypothetical protein
MKKFSTFTGQKVNNEPKVEIKKLNEEDLFKSKVIDLMDDLLKIQTYGPVDRYLRAGNIKITGKEMFLEALMDLMNNKSKGESKAILESLKSTNRDWESIDAKIEEIDFTEKEIVDELKMEKNIISTYKKWGADKNLCTEMFEKNINKIEDGGKAYTYSVICDKISEYKEYPNEFFKKISNKYLERSKQLGFQK